MIIWDFTYSQSTFAIIYWKLGILRGLYYPSWSYQCSPLHSWVSLILFWRGQVTCVYQYMINMLTSGKTYGSWYIEVSVYAAIKISGTQHDRRTLPSTNRLCEKIYHEVFVNSSWCVIGGLCDKFGTCINYKAHMVGW